MSEVDDPRAEIACRIKEARRLAGLSQTYVAQVLGLHRPSISEIEAGHRRVTADELSKMSVLFDVDLAWLHGQTPDTLKGDDPNLLLAARELAKLTPEDADRLLKILAAMRRKV